VIQRGEFSIVGQVTNDNTAHAHCMLGTKAHSECVMFIAFQREQCLQECTSSLRLYNVCLVIFVIILIISLQHVSAFAEPSFCDKYRIYM